MRIGILQAPHFHLPWYISHGVPQRPHQKTAKSATDMPRGVKSKMTCAAESQHAPRTLPSSSRTYRWLHHQLMTFDPFLGDWKLCLPSPRSCLNWGKHNLFKLARAPRPQGPRGPTFSPTRSCPLTARRRSKTYMAPAERRTSVTSTKEIPNSSGLRVMMITMTIMKDQCIHIIHMFENKIK